jgi:hypothetical protein
VAGPAPSARGRLTPPRAAQDVAPFGISELRVTRVTRIHNRFLRNRFEERLEQLVDTSDACGPAPRAPFSPAPDPRAHPPVPHLRPYATNPAPPPAPLTRLRKRLGPGKPPPLY